MRALEWIDRYGDRDGDGFVEYEKRSERGLDNQSWKDSHDSQRFADGRVAEPPIAPCEVQGYVFDAKQRMAEIAREVWRDRELGDRLDREAKELRRAFNEAYWVDERGGYYALALDGDKRPVDSMCSNMGHLLWSGIVPSERADAVVDRLMGEELWSGWGVRTMSSGGRRLQPARVPQRHRLAPRQLPDRARARALPTLARGAEDRAAAAGGGRVPRPPAAGGVRGHAAGRDAVPDRVSDRRAAAGVGGRHADPPPTGAARSRAVAPPAHAGDGGAGGAAVVGGIAAAGRRAVLRPPLDGARRRRARQRRARVNSCPDQSRCGSPCRRPATAASSGSCGCSPTGWSTPGTTSRSSPRATRTRKRSSCRCTTRPRASSSGRRSSSSTTASPATSARTSSRSSTTTRGCPRRRSAEPSRRRRCTPSTAPWTRSAESCTSRSRASRRRSASSPSR